MELTEEAFKLHDDEMNGYCRNCDDVTVFGGCEPDARRYPCDTCEKKTVYGVSEALIRGWIDFTE